LPALAVALVAGIALRLVWVEDMEWKGDEIWTLAHAMAIGRTEPWPWIGMPTSIGLPHPGGSIWVFVLLVRLFGVTTPPELARAVQLTNIAAILLLVPFCLRAVPPPARERWLWAVALLCVNPVAVIMERKIWPPTIVPLASVGLIVGWWHRARSWGAFLWGAVGAAIGQLHTGALIFAFAIVLWTVLFDRRSVRWRWWFAGSTLAAWPLLPWLVELVQRRAAGEATSAGMNYPVATFYLRWVTEPFGFGAEYSLGPVDFRAFLATPIVAGHPTFLMAALHVVIGAVAVALLGAALWRVWRTRPRAAAILVGDEPGRFLVNAALWAYGGLLTAARLSVHRHYMPVIHVLKFLWVSEVAFFAAGDSATGRIRVRRLLLVLWLAQAAIAGGMLHYIHVTQVIRGEYGATWGSQRPDAQRP
jgi:hypothetical protein